LTLGPAITYTAKACTEQRLILLGKTAMTSLLSNAQAADYLVVSSAGQHAQEDWHTIIDRKQRDIAKVGHTIWVTNSGATRVETVQRFCNDHHDARYVLFVAKKAKKSDQKGPTTAHPAKHYSVDQKKWLPIPNGLSPVTGKITRATTGFGLTR
jgi:hypothetical protein